MMVCWKSICACLTCFTNILSGNENKTNVFSSWAGWGNEMKMKFNFFWKMIPIKNIIVISIIWLAWAITASFYSTHANVSHVPTPPPPPPHLRSPGQVVRRSQAFPLKQCPENVQINSDQEAYKGEIQCPVLPNQIYFLTNHNKFHVADLQLLLLSSNQNTVFHRK